MLILNNDWVKKYMFSLGLLSAILLLCYCISCNTKEEQKVFELPVEYVVKLDSTELGISTVADSLNVPWEITWGPNEQIWFTEQSGTVSSVNPHNGKKKLLLDITHKVHRHRTMGLLGMAVYSEKDQLYVYLNYTTFTVDSTLVSRLERYTYERDSLKDALVILEIPGGRGGHNGSRVVTSGGKIFWATGDIGQGENAQNTSSLNGKILRLNPDGSIPEDNPCPASPVWSLGHRNIQGLVATPAEHLFSSEHGEATDDEVNLIQKGGNYGWPHVEGFCDFAAEKSFCNNHDVREPLITWTPCIAPSGMDFYHSNKIPEWHNSLLLLTLKGVSLRALKLDSSRNKIRRENIYFDNLLGRLRDICISPSGDVYISTSNRDWNPLGKPAKNDDRIIRIAKINELDNLENLNRNNDTIKASSAAGRWLTTGEKLYADYCASCHKQDGMGVPGVFPALRNNKYIAGDKKQLIEIILEGSAGLAGLKKEKGAAEKMPAFDFLTDREITDIVTFIREGFGDVIVDNTKPEYVKSIRKQK